MSQYSHNMSDEPKPKIKKLLDEGWRKFKILSGADKVSKGGNKMIVLEVEDKFTGYVEDWYCVTTQGKRWFLKSVLAACEVAASQDGVYDWDLKDILDKEIAGLVVHEPNKYINRDGIEVETTQHKIQEIKKVDDAIAWDD